MKVLQVIDQGFRTTTEEQDDAILWLARSMRGAGAELRVLLGGHAVHYGVLRQRQPALTVAGWRQTEPADLPTDIASLVESGVPVYAVAEDMSERGLDSGALQRGVTAVARADLARLYEEADQVWQW